MNLIKQLFGKSLYKINETDLINFFAIKRPETNNIEFKSHAGNATIDAILEKLAKTVCAYLNSEGGILIYGSPMGKVIDGETEKSFIGELKPCPTHRGPDWFINKFSSQISPMPKGINVHVVEASGGYIYIVYVEDSEYKPFQIDGRYLIRLDGQNKPAPHYFVEALIKQIKHTELLATIRVNDINQGHSGKLYLNLDILVANNSPNLIEAGVSYQLVIVGAESPGNGPVPNVDIFNGEGQCEIRRRILNENIFYGQPKIYSHRLLIVDTKIRVLLAIGANNCPIKVSEFLIDISKTTDIKRCLKLVSDNKKAQPTEDIKKTFIDFRSHKRF